MIQDGRSNLTNKYNPQERVLHHRFYFLSSNLTNKYNPQELFPLMNKKNMGSNLTNKYNPQERIIDTLKLDDVQILPINTILKNVKYQLIFCIFVQILPINTILKNFRT